VIDVDPGLSQSAGLARAGVAVRPGRVE